MLINTQYNQSNTHFCPRYQATPFSAAAPTSSFFPAMGDSASISPFAQMLSLFSGSSLLGGMFPAQQPMGMSMQNPGFGSRPSSPTPGAGNMAQLGPSRYDSIIREAAAKYNLDPALIKAVIKKESSFDPNAGSSAGARGLMQLMPATFRAMGGGDATNPRDNIFAGTKYLSQMLKQHDGDLSLALAAYNAGPGNVRKYGGIPPFTETRNYVSTITRDYRASQQA